MGSLGFVYCRHHKQTTTPIERAAWLARLEGYYVGKMVMKINQYDKAIVISTDINNPITQASISGLQESFSDSINIYAILYISDHINHAQAIKGEYLGSLKAITYLNDFGKDAYIISVLDVKSINITRSIDKSHIIFISQPPEAGGYELESPPVLAVSRYLSLSPVISDILVVSDITNFTDLEVETLYNTYFSWRKLPEVSSGSESVTPPMSPRVK